jgi:hypothetical protein
MSDSKPGDDRTRTFAGTPAPGTDATPTFSESSPTYAEGMPTFADSAPTFAEGALTVADGDPGPPAPATSTPPTIGRYRILRLIGEGGMGAVYEAEQDQPRRTVALKVIKPGLAGPELLRRFAQESQALGRLQHPGIAQIYDAGTADTGYGSQPYFAMEFIRGQALSAYADERRLDGRRRLELMVKVCDAVHHAHQRGLIHRDLKPGNILVDDSGQPKILDFGVARVTDSDAQATMQTDVGQLVGTLAYMSPEQVLADPLDIDIRSDVYALGVILYELLAGRLPYEISKRLHEALQTIREEDPSKLSSIDRRYRGDVETIAAKALEKDKTRRYASAAELAADITRYLKDEPIVAQPPTASYQLQKFARRHKALVGGVAAVFVVLVAGVVVSTWQAVRASRAETAAVADRDRAAAAERAAVEQRDRAATAERTATAARDDAVAARSVAVAAEQQAKQERDRAIAEKERADTESATATAVSEFLQRNLFEQVAGGGGESTAPGLSVSAALDRTAARIDQTFDGKPLVEAGVREAVGAAYMGVSLWDKAKAQLDRALALRRGIHGDEDIATLKTWRLLASVDANQRRWEPAEAVMERIVAVQRRRSGPDNPDTLQFTFELAYLYLQAAKPARAEPLARQVVDARRRTLGVRHGDTITAMVILAAIHEQQREFGDAVRLATEALEASSQTLGENDTLTLGARTVVQRASAAARAVEAGRSGGPTAADRAARDEFLATAARSVDSATATSLPAMILLAANRASIAMTQGKPEGAVQPLVDAIEAARRAGQEELSLMSLLAGAYAMQQKFAEAEATLAPVLAKPDARKELMANVLPFALRAVGGGLRNAGRFAEAERYLATLVPLVLVAPGEAAQQTRIDAFLLADVYAAQGKYAESERAFTELVGMHQRVAGPDSLAVHATQTNVAWVRLKQGRLADAETTFREALNGMVRTSPESWERFNGAAMLGATLAEQKRFAEAEPLLISGYEGMRTSKPVNPNAFSRFSPEDVGAAILKLYADWGRVESRAEWEGRLRK